MEKVIRVLIADPIHPDATSRLVEKGFDVHELPEENKTKLKDIIASFDAIICRTSTPIDEATINAAKQLSCVALASTGYDRIDLSAAKKRKIAVLGLPSYNKEIDPERDGNFVSTAEHTILLILAALGDFYHAYSSMKEGRWEKKYLVGHELANKTVGIIGFGRIATLVARRLQPFKARIVAFDPYVDKTKASSEKVALVSLKELCLQSDIICIHVPKTEETVGMVGKEEFELMKKGVFLINTARFAIIDEKSLIDALKSGKVMRAALDVFHDEPDGVNWNLVQMPNVIATPHIGGSTHEAWRRISLSSVENVISFFEGKVCNLLNP